MDLRPRVVATVAAAIAVFSSVSVAAWTGDDLSTLSGTVTAASPAVDSSSSQGCALSQPTLVEATTESCMSCHTQGSGSGHPVDVTYGAAARPRGSMLTLRKPDEVVRRGVFLSHGKITCLTCHDARSPWKDHIALPPGAKPEPGVNPRQAATYDPRTVAQASSRLEQLARDGARPSVTPKPLCLACHAFD